MVSRRNMLLTLAATGATVFHRGLASASNADFQSDITSINFRVPAGACDCHVHVYGDTRRFPFAADRPYTPTPAPVARLRQLLAKLHMDRVVIVTPAVYGTNNDCTLDAIRQLGFQARGIALIAQETTDSELDRLRHGGICGIRLNFETFGVSDPKVAVDRFQDASKRAARRGWHVQVNTRLSIVEALEEHVLSGPATVVFDHFAQAKAELGINQAGFAALMRLLESGRAYVKISAAYRISSQPPDYADVVPLARKLIAANPARILWGSDWPHPDAAPRPGSSPSEPRPPLPVDDRRVLNQMVAWAPEPAIRHLILVDNPARLYEF